MPAIVSQYENTCLEEILIKLDEVKADVGEVKTDVIENGEIIEDVLNMLPKCHGRNFHYLHYSF